MSYLATRKTYLNWVFWFFVGNGLLAWVIGLHYLTTIIPFRLTTPTLVNQFLACLFLFSAFLGQLGLFTCIAATLATIFLFLFPPKKVFIFTSSLIIAFLLNCLLCLDTFIFSQYRFHLNGIIWQLVTSGQAIEIFDLSWLEWCYIGVLSAFLLGIEISLATWVWNKLRYKTWKPLYPLSALGFLLFSYYILALLIKSSTALALNQQAYAIPLYYEVLAKLLPSKQALFELESFYRSDFVEINPASTQLHYPLHPLSYSPVKKRPNIVFIVIDSWRFDMLNAINTPHIYRFAQQSWQFQQHFSGGNGTQPGIFSLFYSLPASYWSATINQHKSPVFINKLLAEDYHIGIFASAELLAPPFNQNVFTKIKKLRTTTPGQTPYDRDAYITKEFKQFITHVKSPFFSFLFYDSAHSFCLGNSPINPFQPSTSVCDRLTYTNHTNPNAIFNRYKNALYYVDQLVGQSISLLKKHGLLENTVIIITADHGNEFNDNHLGYWGHGSNFTRYQIQVPFILYWPKQKPAIFKQVTMHYDVVPTLLEKAFEIHNPATDYSIGQSLFEKKERPFLLIHSYTNLGLIDRKRTITIYPSGYFQIQTHQAKPLPTHHLPIKEVLNALAETHRFYSLQKNSCLSSVFA